MFGFLLWPRMAAIESPSHGKQVIVLRWFDIWVCTRWWKVRQKNLHRAWRCASLRGSRLSQRCSRPRVSGLSPCLRNLLRFFLLKSFLKWHSWWKKNPRRFSNLGCQCKIRHCLRDILQGWFGLSPVRNRVTNISWRPKGRSGTPLWLFSWTFIIILQSWWQPVKCSFLSPLHPQERSLPFPREVGESSEPSPERRRVGHQRHYCVDNNTCIR